MFVCTELSSTKNAATGFPSEIPHRWAQGEFVGRVGASQRAQSGFTILEIMIATAILTLGLVGILALFPVAIHSGKQVIERSTAVIIAESVAESIREGMRNNLRYSKDGDAYFVFKHDGVTSTIPALQDREDYRRDYFVLLPKFRGGRQRAFSGKKGRLKALDAARTFLYPETDSNRNGRGREKRAADDGRDYRKKLSDGRTFYDVRVEDVYKMGLLLPTMGQSGDEVLDDQKIDALKQYSYAFTLTPSIRDANLSPNPSRFIPAGRLFHVRVMVFRSFIVPDKDARADFEPPEPIHELDFEVCI